MLWEHRVDVVGETKKKKFYTKILNQLHSCVDTWLYLPSDDTARGIFTG